MGGYYEKMNRTRIRLNGTQLKLLAIICMTIDHAAVLFLPSDSTIYLLLRFIGRWTAPIMAFQLAEGFRHTKSFHRYLGRLLLFAVISQPFYIVMVKHGILETGIEICTALNVMFPLAIGLVMMRIITKLKEKPNGVMLYLALVPCLLITELCDWKSLIPVWAVQFCLCKKLDSRMICFYLAVTAVLSVAEFGSWYESFKDFSFQLGTLTAILPIRRTTGSAAAVAEKLQNRSADGHSMFTIPCTWQY